MSNCFKESLNLPQTAFPMRANLAKREPERINHWESIQLYNLILKKNEKKERFILHDGPPFTNGNIHLGHVLNKTLKDITLRYKSMCGFFTPYRIGWDCHGLPIEHAVSKEMRAKNKTFSPVEMRQACSDFSSNYIKIQEEQFQRLGVLTHWDKAYETKKPQYEADILRTFAVFVEKGLVYRSKKPVYWSIPCATALADAEIEYKPHVSPSIWVPFPIEDPSLLKMQGNVSIVIWTTTPWTLPANLAVAVHPRLDYVAIRYKNESYLVAHARAEDFIQQCQLEGASIEGKWKGAALNALLARHPFINRKSPIVLADYVTTDSGTGCVHIAPGHGQEDYRTGIEYGLEIYSPLDDNACYIDDGQIHPSLVGLSVLEPGKGKQSPANNAVLALLKKKNSLLQIKRHEHSYPHCWRSKTPLIFRAMHQWFVSLDNSLREKASEAIDQVQWYPEWGKNRIQAAIENRPDWCISRQRAWGVPLPVFFDEKKEAYLDAKVICAIADKVEKKGADIWFEDNTQKLLEGITLPEHWQNKKLFCGRDTLDVWIDSGVSHRAVLKRDESLAWPADLYLEGSDQHRGWFQSSLWTALVADGAPPYKKVLTHGFVVNEDGSKLSKQAGSKSATTYLNTLGADILRLLIASEDYSGDIPFSENIVKQVSNTYRLFRNTFRFQMGNLYDFTPGKDNIPVADMLFIDRWALNETASLIQSVKKAYETYAFHKVYQLCNQYCNITLSAIYHDILKDRLYTYRKDGLERHSAQTAIHLIFDTFLRLLAPILVFTADEVFAYAQKDQPFISDSIHLQTFPEVPEEWVDSTIADEMKQLLKVRDQVNEQMEQLRQEKTIGQGLDAKVTLLGHPEDELFQVLEKRSAFLAEIFIVSQVHLHAKTDIEKKISITTEKATGERCPRCWRWVPSLCPSSLGEICERCNNAIT